MGRVIYLDNNSTTRPYDRVIRTMAAVAAKEYGNPSASYSLGRRAHKLIESARRRISNALDVRDPDKMIFTSGASESNNIVIRGWISRCVERMKDGRKPRVLCAATEHSSVFHTCMEMAKQGLCTVDQVPVDANGVVKQEALQRMVDEDTRLVCVMLGNNELGTIQDVNKLVRMVKERQPRAFFLSDATQIVGKYRLSLTQLGVDGVSFSAHKFHGPKGIGALYLREPKAINPCMTGGMQEHNLRAGTENTPAIVGMALALEMSMDELDRGAAERVKAMRDYIERKLVDAAPRTIVNARTAPRRMYNTLSVTLPITGIESSAELMKKLDRKGVQANAGSACSQGKPSRVLAAIGLPPERVATTVRITLSFMNTMAECKAAVRAILELVRA